MTQKCKLFNTLKGVFVTVSKSSVTKFGDPNPRNPSNKQGNEEFSSWLPIWPSMKESRIDKISTTKKEKKNGKPTKRNKLNFQYSILITKSNRLQAKITAKGYIHYVPSPRLIHHLPPPYHKFNHNSS